MFLPYLTIVIAMNFERSLEFKLPTIWTDEQAEAGRAREEKRREEEDQGRERARRKKMQVREKADKLRNTMFWGSGGSKSRLAKAADAEPSGGMNNCTPLRHDEFKMYKAHHSRSIFGS